MTWLDGTIGSEDLRALADHLRRIPKVSRTVGLDDVDEDVWAIAQGLRDIIEDSRRLAVELVPQLMQLDPSDPRAEDLLYEIGEALRHIRYHTSDSRFYGYLAEPGPAPTPSPTPAPSPSPAPTPGPAPAPAPAPPSGA